MAEIADDVVVDCLSGEAASYLAGFFERLAVPGVDGSVLTLRLAVGDATISRDVIARLTAPKASPGHRVMGVSWRPKNGGPYPDFDGTIALSDQDGTASKLTISGTYGPPGGVIGAAFDAVLGRRMASASIKALLDTLKTAIETARTQSSAVAARYLPTYE